ncbi:MAG: hypothetical protein KKA79_08515 [Nanoarchaeota archaeon]|nr:hypothetical protein [Nanoarchaeota archaeon]
MGIGFIKHIRRHYVKSFPEHFSKLTDLPIMEMYDILREKGISEEDIRIKSTEARFSYTLKHSGIALDGLVLDLCSGSISVGCVYNPDKVVCYDFLTEIMDKLKGRNLKAVQADISDMSFYGKKRRYLPFKNNAFDYFCCEGFPMLPYSSTKVPYTPKGICSEKSYVKNTVKEIIRVTKNYAIISSIPLLELFPKEYKHRLDVKKTKESIFVIDCRKNYKKKKSNKKI